MALTANQFDGLDLQATACAIVNSGTCVPSTSLTCEETIFLLAALIFDLTGAISVSGFTSADLETVMARAKCVLQVPLPPIDFDKLVAYAVALAHENHAT